MMQRVQCQCWQACHRFRATSSSSPTVASHPRQLGICIQRNTGDTRSRPASSNNGRVVRATRQVVRSALPSSNKTPPGRLIRRQRRAIPSNPSPVHANDDELSTESQSRPQRKAAIERRRIFLENGGTASLPFSSTSTPEEGASNAETEIVNVSNDERGMSHTLRSANDNYYHADEVSKDDSRKTIQHDGAESTQYHQPRRRRIPLHCIGNGILSAADLHRSHIKQQREHRRELQKQKQRRPQKQEQENVDDTHTCEVGHTARTLMESNAHHAISVGESLVASQSATAKYRLRHRKTDDTAEEANGVKDEEGKETSHHGDSKLDKNPSDINVDGIDHPSPRSDTIDGASESDFEERYQRLRRQQQSGEVSVGDEISASFTEGTKQGWLPFHWLWARKK